MEQTCQDCATLTCLLTCQMLAQRQRLSAAVCPGIKVVYPLQGLFSSRRRHCQRCVMPRCLKVLRMRNRRLRLTPQRIRLRFRLQRRRIPATRQPPRQPQRIPLLRRLPHLWVNRHPDQRRRRQLRLQRRRNRIPRRQHPNLAIVCTSLLQTTDRLRPPLQRVLSRRACRSMAGSS